MNVPDDLRYTADHEWARLEGEHIRVGITDYAQDALGDIVYVQLPGPGTSTVVGQAMCELESTKSVSDVYAPLDGTVVEVNSELADAPERVNEDPYGEGWICLIEPSSRRGLRGPAQPRRLPEASRGLTSCIATAAVTATRGRPTSARLVERHSSAQQGRRTTHNQQQPRHPQLYCYRARAPRSRSSSTRATFFMAYLRAAPSSW